MDEYVHAAGNAAVPRFGDCEFARRREEEIIVEVLTTGSKTRTKSPKPKRQYAWDQKVDMSDKSCAPVDFADKYSTAHAIYRKDETETVTDSLITNNETKKKKITKLRQGPCPLLQNF